MSDAPLSLKEPTSQPQIRHNVRGIIYVHKHIIQSMKAQKVRHDDLLDKYKLQLHDEVQMPSNRLSRWAQLINIFLEGLITGKLHDYELLKGYERFIDDLVKYEEQYVIEEGFLERLEANFDGVVETILRLEKRYLDLAAGAKERVMLQRIQTMHTYQEWYPGDHMSRKGFCHYCGIVLNQDVGDLVVICRECNLVPAMRRPVVLKKGRLVRTNDIRRNTMRGTSTPQDPLPPLSNSAPDSEKPQEPDDTVDEDASEDSADDLTDAEDVDEPNDAPLEDDPGEDDEPAAQAPVPPPPPASPPPPAMPKRIIPKERIKNLLKAFDQKYDVVEGDPAGETPP